MQPHAMQSGGDSSHKSSNHSSFVIIILHRRRAGWDPCRAPAQAEMISIADSDSIHSAFT